jgi:putative nucleotidyltransferase with HDIG domain
MSASTGLTAQLDVLVRSTPVNSSGPESGIPALQLATVAEIGARIASCHTIETILHVVASEVRWILSFNRCTLTLLTADGAQFRIFSLGGNGRVTEGTTRYAREHGLAGWVIKHNQALRLEELAPSPSQEDPADEEILAPGRRSLLILPLFAEGAIVGTINFSAARPRAYPPETLAVARLLALQIGGALGQALLLQQLDSSETVILSLARAIEAKDPNTEGHCQRLAIQAERLGRALGFDAAHLHTLRMAAILHDVGKIAVPEAILGKPGALTDAEYTILKRHPSIGAEICAPLRAAHEILPAIRHHHERWDGAGYPHGLAGEAIPLDARIIAIVDAFDAMTADRPYRRGLPLQRTLTIMRENRGPQWDPALLAIFLDLVEREGPLPVGY